MIGRRRFLVGLSALVPGLVRAEPRAAGLEQRPPPRPPRAVGPLIAEAGLTGKIGYVALGPVSGAVLDAHQPDRPRPPASTLKIVTALYALDRLGPDHRFRTRAIRAGDMLVLAGGGDPHLDTDGLAVLAEQLVATGQTSPARFAVWGGALPQIAEIAPEQDDHLAYNPAMSGMMLNFNRVHLGWRDGGAGLSAEARADGHSPRAYTVTARAGEPGGLFGYSASARREDWVVSRAAMRRAGSRWLPVRKPELYAGDVFQTLCRARGLVLPRPEVIAALPDGDELAGLDSPPLSEILHAMLKYSTNLTAEALGLHASGAADLQGSAAAMAGWLRAHGVGDAFDFRDHSGLSGQNALAPITLARLLAQSGDALTGLLKPDPLADDLGRDPVAGLAVEGKTGTLNFVSNLAGFATGADGRRIVFAIFCSDEERRLASAGQELPRGVIGWTRRAKQLQRAMIRALLARSSSSASVR